MYLLLKELVKGKTTHQGLVQLFSDEPEKRNHI